MNLQVNLVRPGDFFACGPENRHWSIPSAKALAQALKTDNVLIVHSDRAVVDAAVYIGKDFNQIIEPEQGEEK